MSMPPFTRSAVFLWMVMLGASASGWVVTILATRIFDVAAFTYITTFNQVVLVMSLVSVSIGMTANRMFAGGLGEISQQNAALGMWSIIVGIIGYIVALLLSVVTMPDMFWVMSIGYCVLIFMTHVAWLRGSFQAFLAYDKVALSLLIESVVKVVVAYIGYVLDSTKLIYFSFGLASAASMIVLMRMSKNMNWYPSQMSSPRLSKHTLAFWIQGVVQRSGIILVMTTDVFLALALLPKEIAGVYSLVSLTGKFLYFFMQTSYGVLVPVLSNRIAIRKNSWVPVLSMIILTAIVGLGLYIGLVTNMGGFGTLVYGSSYWLVRTYLGIYLVGSTLYTGVILVCLYAYLHKRFWVQFGIFVGVFWQLLLLVGNQQHTIDQILDRFVTSSLLSLICCGLIFLVTHRHDRLRLVVKTV